MRKSPGKCALPTTIALWPEKWRTFSRAAGDRIMTKRRYLRGPNQIALALRRGVLTLVWVAGVTGMSAQSATDAGATARASARDASPAVAAVAAPASGPGSGSSETAEARGAVSAAVRAAPTSVATLPPTPITAAALRAELETMLAAPRFAGALWGVSVVSLQTGEVLFSHGAERRMSPASNAKLFTAALALDRLGGASRLQTRVLAWTEPECCAATS